MALTPPATLSPSKVATFKDCALAFRFSAIERLPEPSSPPAVRGTLAHLALQHLFRLPPPERTPDASTLAFGRAVVELRAHPEFAQLELDDEAEGALFAEAEAMVQRYFQLEDPRTVNAIGLELKLEAQLDGIRLRGIIDRLDLDDAGELVVTDYKTGRPPGPQSEQARLGGVEFYAFLCEQLFGRRPARVQLLYLSEPVTIVATPSAPSIRGLQQRVRAIWSAVERACETDDFRPRPSRLCDWCAFQAWCPAFGGDPSRAAADLGVAALATEGAAVPV
jgi:putative RecB family exonuclease